MAWVVARMWASVKVPSSGEPRWPLVPKALETGRSYRLAWDAAAARLLPRSRTNVQLDPDNRTTLDLAGSR